MQVLLQSASMLFSSDNKDVWDHVQEVTDSFQRGDITLCAFANQSGTAVVPKGRF